MKVMYWIKRTVDTHVTPLAYLFAAWQAVFGFNHFFEDDDHGAGATIISQIDALIPSELWGLAIGISSVVLILGMLFRNTRAIQISSFVGFSAWIMASISYALNGYLWLHTPSAILVALMFGYFFLAAGLNQLWDYYPDGE